MIFIISGRKSRGGHIAAVFCILYRGICHGADNAAYIICAAYVQTVIDEVVFPAESRIGCFSHKAAHIGALAGDAAQVIARAGQGASRERTDKPACIIFSPLCRAGNSPGIDQIFKIRFSRRSDNTAHVGAAAGDGCAVHDVADLRAVTYLSGQSAHIIPSFDAAAYESDILNHSSVSDHAEKADVAGIPVDIQIENIIIQSVEFTGKSNLFTNIIRADNGLKAPIRPVFRGGGVNAVPERILAAGVGTNSLELFNILHPHIAVETVKVSLSSCHRRQLFCRFLFILISSFVFSLIIGIIAENDLTGIGGADVDILRVHLRIVGFQPFRINDDAAAVKGDMVCIDIPETHENRICIRIGSLRLNQIRNI